MKQALFTKLMLTGVLSVTAGGFTWAALPDEVSRDALKYYSDFNDGDMNAELPAEGAGSWDVGNGSGEQFVGVTGGEDSNKALNVAWAAWTNRAQTVLAPETKEFTIAFRAKSGTEKGILFAFGKKETKGLVVRSGRGKGSVDVLIGAASPDQPLMHAVGSGLDDVYAPYVLTGDGKVLKLWANGKLMAQIAEPEGDFFPGDFQWGRRFANEDKTVNGDGAIDWMGVWARPLTPEEIAALPAEPVPEGYTDFRADAPVSYSDEPQYLRSVSVSGDTAVTLALENEANIQRINNILTLATDVSATDEAKRDVFGFRDGANTTVKGEQWRNSFVRVSGGNYGLIVGGGEMGWENPNRYAVLNGLLYTEIGPGAVADHVIGAVHKGGDGTGGNGSEKNMLIGDALTVVKGTVNGVVIGGATSAHMTVPVIRGNTTVRVEKVQAASSLDFKGGIGNRIIGGSSWYHQNNGGTKTVGNTRVEVMLPEDASGEFGREIVGGSFGKAPDRPAVIDGDSSVEITAPAGVEFTQPIYGGSVLAAGSGTVRNATLTLNSGIYSAAVTAGGFGAGLKVTGKSTLVLKSGVVLKPGIELRPVRGGAQTADSELKLDGSFDLSAVTVGRFDTVRVKTGNTLILKAGEEHEGFVVEDGAVLKLKLNDEQAASSYIPRVKRLGTGKIVYVKPDGTEAESLQGIYLPDGSRAVWQPASADATWASSWIGTADASTAPTSGTIVLDYTQLDADAEITIPEGTFDAVRFVGPKGHTLTVKTAEGVTLGDLAFRGNVNLSAETLVSAGQVNILEGSALGLDVAEGQTVNLTKAIAGNLTKLGAGTLVQKAAVGGSLTVAGGTYKFTKGNLVDTVRVGAGATLDLNGTPDGYGRFTLEEGATLANTGDAIGTPSRQIARITLEGDATVNAAADFGLVANGHGDSNLDLNGHTLTKTGAGKFWLVHTGVAAGTLDVRDGSVVSATNNTTTFVGGTVIKLAQGASLVKDGGSIAYAGDITFDIADDMTVPENLSGAVTKRGVGVLTCDGVLSGDRQLTVEAGTLVIGNTANTRIGKVLVKPGAVLDLTKEGVSVIRTEANGGYYEGGNGHVTVEGTLITRDWSYNKTLGALAHKKERVHLAATATLQMVGNCPDSSRGFTVLAPAAGTGSVTRLLIPAGASFVKTIPDFAKCGVANNGTLSIESYGQGTPATVDSKTVTDEDGVVHKGINGAVIVAANVEVRGQYANLSLAPGAIVDASKGTVVATASLTVGDGVVIQGARDDEALKLTAAEGRIQVQSDKLSVPQSLKAVLSEDGRTLSLASLYPEADDAEALQALLNNAKEGENTIAVTGSLPAGTVLTLNKPGATVRFVGEPLPCTVQVAAGTLVVDASWPTTVDLSAEAVLKLDCGALLGRYLATKVPVAVKVTGAGSKVEILDADAKPAYDASIALAKDDSGYAVNAVLQDNLVLNALAEGEMTWTGIAWEVNSASDPAPFDKVVLEAGAIIDETLLNAATLHVKNPTVLTMDKDVSIRKLAFRRDGSVDVSTVPAVTLKGPDSLKTLTIRDDGNPDSTEMLVAVAVDLTVETQNLEVAVENYGCLHTGTESDPKGGKVTYHVTRAGAALPGRFFGTGSLTKTGPERATLVMMEKIGTNDWLGNSPLTVAEGVLTLTPATTDAWTGTATIASGATLEVTQEGEKGLYGRITGAGNLKVPAGTLGLRGDNDFTGGTEIAEGAKVVAYASKVLGTGALTLNGTLAVNMAGDVAPGTEVLQCVNAAALDYAKVTGAPEGMKLQANEAGTAIVVVSEGAAEMPEFVVPGEGGAAPTPDQAKVLTDALTALGVTELANKTVTLAVTANGKVSEPAAVAEDAANALEVFDNVAAVVGEDNALTLKVAYTFGVTSIAFAEDNASRRVLLTATVARPAEAAALFAAEAPAAFKTGVKLQLTDAEGTVIHANSDGNHGGAASAVVGAEFDPAGTKLFRVKAVKTADGESN